MKQEFIKVNGIIQDYQIYKKHFNFYSELIEDNLKELLSDAVFSLEEKKSSSYNNKELKFYNKRIDFEIRVLFKKRSMEEFA
jgi:hypothetical protein